LLLKRFVCCRRLRQALFALIVALPSLAVGEPQRLTHDGALKLSPVFTDNGQTVLFSVHDEPNRVSLVRLRVSDGRQERVDAALTAHQFDADVSLDGRYLCFVLTTTSPQSILVIRDLKAATEARFTPQDPRATVRGPKITPNQERVVFTLSDLGGQQIGAVNMRGEGLKRLTESAGINAWPAISPDGRKIAFGSSPEGSFQLYVMNSEGEDVRQLTSGPLRNMRPAWSPDGKRIAFTSARDGNLEIYVMDANGTNTRRITQHPERDDFAVWHPDGQRLLIISERDGDSDLHLIDVDEN
jgi:Tol biopolymer transport system component